MLEFAKVIQGKLYVLFPDTMHNISNQNLQ